MDYLANLSSRTWKLKNLLETEQRFIVAPISHLSKTQNRVSFDSKESTMCKVWGDGKLINAFPINLSGWRGQIQGICRGCILILCQEC